MVDAPYLVNTTNNGVDHNLWGSGGCAVILKVGVSREKVCHEQGYLVYFKKAGGHTERPAF